MLLRAKLSACFTDGERGSTGASLSKASIRSIVGMTFAIEEIRSWEKNSVASLYILHGRLTPKYYTTRWHLMIPLVLVRGLQQFSNRHHQVHIYGASKLCQQWCRQLLGEIWKPSSPCHRLSSSESWHHAGWDEQGVYEKCRLRAMQEEQESSSGWLRKIIFVSREITY